MSRTALRRKLLRELWQLRMQLLSIALVVATGVMTVVTMSGAYQSLRGAQERYYREARFAEVWAPLVRAPLGIRERLIRIPGVAAVDTRITLQATLDLPGLDMPAQGRFVSLPAFGRPRLNDLLVESGRYLEHGNPGEVLVSAKFAAARNLGPGDSISVVLNGRAQRLRIVGIASTPEFAYAVQPGALLPEYERYGVFWMSETFLGPAFDMAGAFNEAVLALDPAANVAAVLQQVDAVLELYGGLGSYPREEQFSHLILDNELAEIRTHGLVLPAIFLGVAVFLLHQVLGRLVATQRGEIAVLKAFGYSDRETAWHFLQFALLPVAVGALLGALGGVYLGAALMRLYGQYLEIPGLAYRFSPALLLLAAGLSLAGACGGALASVQRVLRLPPAEAMRPETPARFRPGPLERLGLGRVLPAAGRMILRSVERRPLHALMGVLGMALAMAILVVGMFMFDSISWLMDRQFRQIQREDVAVLFREPAPASVYHELARLPGVTLAETWRGAPARLRAGQLHEEVLITGLTADSALRRLLGADGRVLPLPAGGIVVSAILAAQLQVSPGDRLILEWLDGERLHATVQVSGITEDYIGVNAYIEKDTLRLLNGGDARVSGAWLRTLAEDDSALHRQLKQMPGVSGVSSPMALLAVFEEQMAQTLLVSSAFLLGFAGILAYGVIYNSARIALAERGRELASLRVMGFYRQEVATLLLGEQGLLTLLALPLGGLIGYGISAAIVTGLASESFRIPFVASLQTYLLAAGLILLAALISTVAVRRRLDALELVAVLKTRE
jgi:putative ABC transport system permease protein